MQQINHGPAFHCELQQLACPEHSSCILPAYVEQKQCPGAASREEPAPGGASETSRQKTAARTASSTSPVRPFQKKLLQSTAQKGRETQQQSGLGSICGALTTHVPRAQGSGGHDDDDDPNGSPCPSCCYDARRDHRRQRLVTIFATRACIT
jgi:hypothetical protein